MRTISLLFIYVFVVFFGVSSSKAQNLCDDYHNKLTATDNKIQLNQNIEVVKKFCLSQKLPEGNSICPQPFDENKLPTYAEIKKQYNEAISRSIVLKGLLQIKTDFEEKARDFALIETEHLDDIQKKYREFQQSLRKAQIVEEGFENDYEFHNEQGTPHLAYLSFLSQSPSETQNTFETYDRFMNEDFCQKPNNSIRSLCQNYSNMIHLEDRKVLFDIFQSRYVYQGQDNQKAHLPSAEDLEFARNSLDKKQYLEQFQNVLKLEITEGENPQKEKISNFDKGYLKNIEKVLKNYQSNPSESTRKQLLSQMKTFTDKASFIKNQSLNRIDIEKATVDALLPEYKKAFKTSEENTLRESVRKSQQLSETSLKEFQDKFNALAELTQKEVANKEPQIKEELVSALIKKHEDFLKASFHDLNPRDPETKYLNYDINQKRDEILKNQKSCLAKVSKKSFETVASCLLPGESFANNEALESSLQESTLKYQNLKELLGQIESSKEHQTLVAQKDSLFINYLKNCSSRFETSEEEYHFSLCNKEGSIETLNKNLIYLIDESSKVSTLISADVFNQIKNDEDLEAKRIKQEITNPTIVESPETQEITETDDLATPDDTYSPERNPSEKKKKQSTRSTRWKNFTDVYYGESNEPKMNNLDYISRGFLNAAAKMGPSIREYTYYNQMTSQSILHSTYMANAYMNYRLGNNPRLSPYYNNSYLSQLTLNTGGYWRDPLSSRYYYDSSNNDFLYNSRVSQFEISPSAQSNWTPIPSSTASSSLNIPVNFAD